MAWSYTLDFGATAAGRRNQVRLRLGDTDTNRQLLQDEEIDYFLSLAGSVVRDATHRAVLAVLAQFSTLASSQRVGDVWADWDDLRERLLALLRELEMEAARSAAPFAGGTSQDDIDDRDADTDRVRPVFHEDSHRHRDITDDLGPT